MKKSLIAILSLPLVLSLASCGHTHTFDNNVWEKDKVNHWHPATCEHKDEKGDLAAHSGGTATHDHGKICEVCGEEYTEKLPLSPIFGQKLAYRGLYSDFVCKEGTVDKEFRGALLKFYDDESEFRQKVVKELGSLDDGSTVREKYLEDEIEFGSASVTHSRSYDSKTITTYDVNYNQQKGLKYGEFAVNPDNDKQFLLFDMRDDEIQKSIVLQHMFLSENKHVSVLCNYFEFSGIDAKFNLTVTFTLDDKDYVADFTLTYDNGEKSEVTITKQPKDVEVTYPNGCSFSVEVDHPELVKEYQWYGGVFDDYGRPNSMSPLNGYGAKQPTLTLPGIGPKEGTWCFMCLISTENREFFSDPAKCIVENVDDSKPAFFVLDYPVKPGENLNLEHTPYGTGVIQYSIDAKTITFNNVHFNNSNIETDYENVGFSIMSWHNQIDEIDFEFVGQNIWMNEYWEDGHNQGGFALFAHYAGESKIPTINFKGDPLTIIGGTRAISLAAKVNIYNDINCVGAPGRYTGGVYAYQINVKSGASVSGSLGASLLFTISADRNNWGDINIESGARVSGIFNPGKVAVGDTNFFAIHALDKVTIYGADVSLVVSPNYERVTENGQFFIPLLGIESSNSYIEIKDSKVDIDFCPVGVPETISRYLANTVAGLFAFEVAIDNSEVDISVKSKAFNTVDGIYSVFFSAKDSNVNIDVLGDYKVSGIESALEPKPHSFENEKFSVDNLGHNFKTVKEEYIEFEEGQGVLTSLKPILGGEYMSSVTITNSNVVVSVVTTPRQMDESGAYYYIDAGIRAKDFDITLGDHNFIEIHTKNASALVSSYDKAYETPGAFTPSHLTFLDTMTVEGAYAIGEDSYQGYDIDRKKSYTVLCEALFLDTTHTSYQTDIIVTK